MRRGSRWTLDAACLDGVAILKATQAMPLAASTPTVGVLRESELKPERFDVDGCGSPASPRNNASRKKSHSPEEGTAG